MSKTRYTNATLLTMDPLNPFVEKGFLEVENGRITAIGPADEPATESSPSVDLAGQLVMPGMISAHCHFYGQFVRGMPLKNPIENWQQVLSRMWWKVDRLLDPEQVYFSTLLGLIDGLKAGTTTYFDHHVSASCIPGSLDLIAKGMEQAGARGCLCYEVSDRYGPEGARQGIEENRRFIQKTAQHPRLRGLMGMHAGYTLEDGTLAACVQAATELESGCHIHLAEAAADVCHSYHRYDRHVAQRMQEAGVLGPKTILAHGVHLKPQHWADIQQAGATVAHNCQSNLNNAVGCAPVAEMLANGVRVAIGGDGYTYDLLKELSIATIAQRAFRADPSLISTDDQLHLGFWNGSALCQNVFGQTIGVLQPGAAADFVVLQYTPPTPLTASNYMGHLSCCGPQNIRQVVVDGQTVVENGRCTLLDEDAVLQECRQHAVRLWQAL